MLKHKTFQISVEKVDNYAAESFLLVNVSNQYLLLLYKPFKDIGWNLRNNKLSVS